MKVPLSWLKEYIDINLSPDAIAEKLTLAGLEVENYTGSGINFEGIVVGEVLNVEKHPNADKLVVAQVTDGKEEFQVVCGAANCRKGLKVAFAKIGAKLTEESGQTFQIKKSKIRGVESSGMLCAGDELGLSDKSEGILELPSDLVLGTSLEELFADIVFDISLTPNLSHCTSIAGVARELSALTGVPYHLPKVSLKELDDENYSDWLQVSVLNPEDCPRYTCRVIKDVQVGPSPAWLQQRLEKCGLRSINNIVDITNYVLLELGHPLHAFDYDQLEEQRIIVRRAKLNESIQTLDGKNRVLKDHHLVIADGVKPIAIAGIMGGSTSEVQGQTRSVVLESAYFNPISIRKASKELGLSTDASKRFERGTDPNQVLFALDRAASLIEELAGGQLVKGAIDEKFKEFPEQVVTCRLERINHVLGTTLSRGEVENIFNSLGFNYKWDGKDRFIVNIPTYRVDIKAEIDLIEEVARLYGYENIIKGEMTYRSSGLSSDPVYLFEKELQNRLISEGLQEFLTCDLIGPTLLNIVQDNTMPADSLVKVLNPTSIEQSILRTSLLPGLLQVVKHNIDHQTHQIAGFEIGKIHFKDGDNYKEPTVMGIILTGQANPHHWDSKGQEFDFFDLKGIVENLLREFGVRYPIFKNLGLSTFHSGRQASVFVDSLEIGTFGEIHPAIQRRLDVDQRILFGEFNVLDLMQVSKDVDHIRPLSIYPGSERDWTVTIKDDVPYTNVLESVRSQASPILEDVYLLGIYRSDKLGEGFQNMTLRFKYRDSSKTIEQDTVDAVHKRLITEVVNRLGEAVKAL
jgi:phenylalanyl-tRNA synthetase beta chain